MFGTTCNGAGSPRTECDRQLTGLGLFKHSRVEYMTPLAGVTAFNNILGLSLISLGNADVSRRLGSYSINYFTHQ